MMYTVNLECKSLVKAFNVKTSLTMPLVHNLVAAARKSNYNVTTRICCKKKDKPILSLEELIEQVHKHRFYKTEVVYDSKPVECVCPLPSIVFPTPVKILRCWSHDNVNITFFELEYVSDLVSINFDAFKKAFEDRGLDLCKSKTEGLWYTHNDIDMSILNDTDLSIVKTTIKYEYTKREKKVEL